MNEGHPLTTTTTTANHHDHRVLLLRHPFPFRFVFFLVCFRVPLVVVLLVLYVERVRGPLSRTPILSSSSSTVVVHSLELTRKHVKREGVAVREKRRESNVKREGQALSTHYCFVLGFLTIR